MITSDPGIASAQAAPPPAPSVGGPARRRVGRALVVAIVCSLLIAVASVGASLALGDSVADSLRSSSLLTVRKLRLIVGMDSWAAMWSGLARQREGTGSPYERTWALYQCKFQYPPSALLLLEWMPEPTSVPMACVPREPTEPPDPDAWSVGWAAKSWLSVLSVLSVLATVAMSWRLLRRPLPAGPGEARLLLLAGFVGLTFAPLLAGHVLGQVQVFMNLAMAVALLTLQRQPAVAGVLVGLCCLLKPQYVLFLLWAALRRQWRCGVALLLVFGGGTLVALLVYGLDMHLQYVDWLRKLSQTGESFWLNQTLNGVLNRWFATGGVVTWEPPSFPVYNPVVRWGTLAGAVLMLGLALVWRQPKSSSPHTELDFATMLAALTISSPVGWDHHYGAFLPLFALLLGVMATTPSSPRAAWVALGIGFVALANVWRAPQHLFANPVLGLFASHQWVGALLVFGLLLYWRSRTLAAGPWAPQTPGHAWEAGASVPPRLQAAGPH